MRAIVTPPVELLLSRLEKVRPSGDGWTARCPAHDDHEPSLSVTIGHDGRALVYCHAAQGCTAAEVARAIGLTVRDFFNGRSNNFAPPPPPAPKRSTSPKKGSTRARLGRLIRTYDYVDEDGVLLFQVCRFDPKDFRQRQPTAAGGWRWSLRGARTVLYCLPAVLEGIGLGKPIYLVEGEKDAEALIDRGYVATTIPGGAAKWRPEYAETLAGSHVVCLPDNDTAGRRLAATITDALVGVCASVKVVELPNLPKKGDVSDYFARGGTVADLNALVADVRPIAKAKRWGMVKSWARQR